MAGSMLKFKNEQKLHISKGPGLKSWIIFIGLLLIGLGAAIYLADSMVLKTVSILVCLILGLISMDEWEDCVMDRYQDQVTLTRSNWYDRLCCRVPVANTRVLPLSNIVGVQTVGMQGLHFILTSGSSTPITSHPVEYREGILLTNHISSFLRLDRMEPVLEDLRYDEEDWGDAVVGESSESESGSVRQENTPTHFVLRQRDEIKVLSEPVSSQPNPR